MSVVTDQVRRLDAQLDRIPLLTVPSVGEEDFSPDEAAANALDGLSSPRIDELLRIVKSLSTTSSSSPLLPAWRIQDLLHQSGIVPSKNRVGSDGIKDPGGRASGTNADGRNDDDSTASTQEKSEVSVKDVYEAEVKWLVVGKATIQTYGLLMSTLLDQTIPLSDDIWYWDEVLGSYTNSSIYTVQTSPMRLWAATQDVLHEASARMRTLGPSSPSRLVGSTGAGITARWRRFYGIIQDSVHERSILNIQRKVLSPVALCRAEARRKQAALKRLRQMTASALGILVGEGLVFGAHDDAKTAADDEELPTTGDWKGVVERSVALMDLVLRDVLDLEMSVSEFEEKVFEGAEEDPDLTISVNDSDDADNADDTEPGEKPAILARRLLHVLEAVLPGHLKAGQSLVAENGRPSRLVRYWLPFGIALLSSSTILRILVNRKTDIVEWVTGAGATARDFWTNWVAEPLLKIVGTIRHDANSEIALMSRDSLKADRESLERMVVDFAVDKPQFVGPANSALSDTQVAEIRAKVSEGDVTPVLRAYEKDLKSPFVGAVKGDLIRSLLIQVQKTKVDLEVAISGIDALLKSQELVFGFVGVTPGILVSIAVLRYLRGIVFERRGVKDGNRAGKAVRVLRNVDRILAEAAPGPENVLSYRDHGLLLCEVHVLRSLVSGSMPRDVERDFLEDLNDVANARGIATQERAVKRLMWAYSRWLS